jgi:threonyl-tRNA synthetase
MAISSVSVDEDDPEAFSLEYFTAGLVGSDFKTKRVQIYHRSLGL